MTSEYMFLLALFHAIVALATTAANLYINQRRHLATTRNDGAKLRAALAAELTHLRALHKDNIDALYAGKDILASSRMMSVIYRSNLSRIQTLRVEDISAFVAAYAAGERAEALAAAYGKAHGQTAFSLGKDRPFAADLIAGYEKAAAAAERALRATGLDERAALPLPERAAAPELAAAA